MRNYKALFLSGLLVLTAFASSLADEKDDERTRRCIPTRNIASTAAIDDRNIVFFMRGDPIYLNFLPDNCVGLAAGVSFSYESGGLCSGERIRLAPETYMSGNWCNIGDFQRITKDDLEALRATPWGAPPPRPLPSAEIEDISTESEETQEDEVN